MSADSIRRVNHTQVIFLFPSTIEDISEHKQTEKKSS